MTSTEVPSEVKPDVSSWGSLKDMAANGMLQLDDSAVKDCIIACNAVVGRLRALRKHIADMADIRAFAPSLRSSNTLAQKFVGSAEMLDDILKEHINIQKNMADTFLAAGKAYIRAEVDSEEQIDRIRILDDIPPITKKPGTFYKDPSTVKPASDSSGFLGWKKLEDGKIKNANGNPNGYQVKGLPEKLKDFTGSRFGVPAEAENPQSWDYNRLWSIGNEIDWETAANRAGKWNWMAGELNEVFPAFVNDIGAVTNNGEKWLSDGAGAAAGAVSQYVNDTQDLREGMGLLGANLSYTAGWLQLTKNSMPPAPQDMSGQPQPEGTVATAPGGSTPVWGDTDYPDQTPIYRSNFENTYLVGLPESDGNVPALPFPKTPTSGGGDTGSGSPSDVTGPGAGRGTGPGGGPGAGPGYSGGTGPGLPSAAWQGSPPNAQQAQWSGGGQTADAVARQQTADAQFQREQQAAVRQQQAEAARFQREQQAAAAQQQADQAAQSAALAGQQGAQQAMSAAQQAAQQAMSGLQQAATRPGSPNMPGLPTGLDPKTGLPKLGGGAGGGASAGLGAGSLAKELGQSSKLFPRANIAAAPAGMATGIRAGAMPMSGMPGSPGAAGAPGKGAGDGNNQHKRPTYLESTEHLEEALGEAPRVVKPVVEK